MKKMIYTLALILVALCATQPVYAENKTKEQKKLEKELQKKMKQEADSILFVEALQAVNDRYFILQVDNVRFRNGRSFHSLNTSANFVVVQNDGGIVQTSISQASLGLNGLGGITLPGRVDKIETTFDKKGNATVSFSVLGLKSNVSVQITIPKNSNKATAFVSHTLSSGNFEMSGTILPYRNDNLTIDK